MSGERMNWRLALSSNQAALDEPTPDDPPVRHAPPLDDPPWQAPGDTPRTGGSGLADDSGRPEAATLISLQHAIIRGAGGLVDGRHLDGPGCGELASVIPDQS